MLAAGIPVSFAAVFLVRTGNPSDTGSFMLMERALGGFIPVLIFAAVNVLGLVTVVSSINGKKELKAAHSTTGYTLRRLRISPVSSYIVMYVYYLIVILIFWGLAVASLYALGKVGLLMAGAENANTRLALGILRTEIGGVLIPVAHPAMVVFNIVSIVALSGECARSCYLSWHNGRQSAGVLLIAVPMLLVWTLAPENSYILMAILVVGAYALFSLGDVISREKRSKGDPFMVNRYIGIMDLDSEEFDEEVHLEVNSLVESCAESPEKSVVSRYGRDGKIMGLSRARRRFMPIGSNMEKANFFLGICILAGMGQHLLFYARYITCLDKIGNAIKGVTADMGASMPYFSELQENTYYGYILAVILVIAVQTYWNYEYYNKETKSVYVMKRLPDSKEYNRTIWVAPVIEGIIIIIIMAVHTLIDLGVYLIMTPEAAFQPDCLSHLLPF